MSTEGEGHPPKRPRASDVAHLKGLLATGSPRLQLVDEADVIEGRKRLKSQVWDDFKRVLLDNEPTHFVSCQRCRDLIKNVPGHEGTGTSSMQRHLEGHKK